VLDGAADPAAAGAAEGATDARDEAGGDPVAAAGSGQGEHGVADVGLDVRPAQRGHVAGGHVEDDDVVVGIGAHHGPLGVGSVGKGDLGGAVAQVVGAGQHPVRGDDHAGAACMAADGDGGRGGDGVGRPGGGGDLGEGHLGLRGCL
jgi:hypothetical protein